MSTRRWTLTGPDGRMVDSAQPGRFGGNRVTKIYGRLDCRVALAALARQGSGGTYERNRVFFANAQTAKAAGYRPCRVCRPLESDGVTDGL